MAVKKSIAIIGEGETEWWYIRSDSFDERKEA